MQRLDEPMDESLPSNSVFVPSPSYRTMEKNHRGGSLSHAVLLEGDDERSGDDELIDLVCNLILQYYLIFHCSLHIEK